MLRSTFTVSYTILIRIFTVIRVIQLSFIRIAAKNPTQSNTNKLERTISTLSDNSGFFMGACCSVRCCLHESLFARMINPPSTSTAIKTQVRGSSSGSNIPLTACQPVLRLHWYVLCELHRMNFYR
jgi:hypothetical protein